MKHAKKAFLASALATLLCVTMLIGTTFAWFTDSVTSGGNIIKSGTLNIDLGIKAKGDADYVSVKTDATKKAFNYDKWEPGYTEWVNAKVYTTGNLALKYTMKITANGTVSDLADVIDVYYAASEVALPATRPADLTAAGLTKIGTLKDALDGTVVINDTLIPGSNGADFATLALHMQESAGNEYQNLSIGTDFSLQILATQLTYEEDSFDEKYDENAAYPILSTDAFTDALTTASAGDLISVGATTINLKQTDTISESVSIAGEGPDKTILHIVANEGDGHKLTNDNVSISNVKVDGSDVTSGGYNSLFNVEADGVVVDGCEFTGGGMSTWNSSILVEQLTAQETFTIKNSNITGSFRGVLRESCSGNIVIDNCEIDAVYPFNIDGGNGGSVNVTNSKLHGWTSYSGVDYVKFVNTEFSKGNSGYDNIAAYSDTILENCTFDADFDLYAQTEGFTWTITNCTKNGVAVTAENIKTLFSDADVWNKCTCIVNGVQVAAD